MAKSDLFDEICAAQTEKGARCTVNMILESLPAPDRSALQAAIDDPRIFGTSIAKVLKARGQTISSHTVQRHRRNACGCK